MSYILEALKKAESERHLGSAPSLHAQPAQPNRTSYVRIALWAGLAALLVVGIVVGWLNWPRPRSQATRSAPQQAIVVPAPAARTAALEGPLFAPAPKPAQVAEPVAPPPRSAPIEESLPSVRELPAALARELPPITVGGYIYSPDPAERLLLIDKNLRHEGEEVAPGLVLEKLLPKSAVMNYRGYRYRVPYK